MAGIDARNERVGSSHLWLLLPPGLSRQLRDQSLERINVSAVVPRLVDRSFSDKGSMGADLNNLSYRFVSKHTRKLQRHHAVREVNLGITKSAGVNLDDDLVGGCLWGFPFSYFPFAVYVGGTTAAFLRVNAPEEIRTWILSNSWRRRETDAETRASEMVS
jgi:hypothetical protein